MDQPLEQPGEQQPPPSSEPQPPPLSEPLQVSSSAVTQSRPPSEPRSRGGSPPQSRPGSPEKTGKTPGKARKQRQRAKKQQAKRDERRSRSPERRDKSADRGEATRGFMQKTQMCKFHQEGKCSRGSDCTFAHDPDELKSAPDFTKTRMCENFKNGLCNDPKCTFAHDKSELRKIDPAIAQEVHELRRKRQEDKAGGNKRRRRGRSGSRGRSNSPDGSFICDRCHSTVASVLGMEMCPMCRLPTRFYSDRYFV